MNVSPRPEPSPAAAVRASDLPPDLVPHDASQEVLLSCLARLQAAAADYAGRLGRAGVPRSEVLRRVKMLVGVGAAAEGWTEPRIVAVLTDHVVRWTLAGRE